MGFWGSFFAPPKKYPYDQRPGLIFLWDPQGVTPSVHAIYQLAKLYLGELALGLAQWWHIKSGQSDTRGVTVHHDENSLQYSKGSMTCHHL